jgi:hypothetical protein
MKRFLKRILPLHFRILVHTIISRIQNFLPYIHAKSINKNKYFEYDHRKLHYFIAAHNTTFKNERTVEIPIILDSMDKYKGTDILEIGNVISHYFKSDHVIVDKYESGHNILNYDILDYSPGRKFDLIVSISTFEHIGYDEFNRYGEKGTAAKSPALVINAIEHTKSLLSETGTFIFTVPLGFNDFLDDNIKQKKLNITEFHFMKRVSESNEWEQIPHSEINDIRYGNPYICANGILVGIFKNKKS